MLSREKILATIKENQPAPVPLPLEVVTAIKYEDTEVMFIQNTTAIGSTLIIVNNIDEICRHIEMNFAPMKNNISTLPSLKCMPQLNSLHSSMQLESIELAVVPALFGVAENGAIWVTEAEIKQRVLPFICQHLAVVLNACNLVSNMQQAYQLIGCGTHTFGAFIAGPSKTADIEQSLVLGAHGPKTMTIFLLQ